MASNIVHTTGNRKTSVARATLKKGKGNLQINDQDMKDFVNNFVLQLKIREPFIISGLEGKYDVSVNVFGGGQNTQVEAIRQAIARALVEVTGDEDLRDRLEKYDRSLLVADSRFKEMKKPNNSHARAKRQKSYR